MDLTGFEMVLSETNCLLYSSRTLGKKEVSCQVRQQPPIGDEVEVKEKLNTDLNVRKEDDTIEYFDWVWINQEAVLRYKIDEEESTILEGQKHCPQCGAYFEWKKILERHIASGCLDRFKETVTSDRGSSAEENSSYVCYFCKKNYSHKQTLKYHIKVIHGQNKMQCNKCRRCFSRKGNLCNHLALGVCASKEKDTN